MVVRRKREGGVDGKQGGLLNEARVNVYEVAQRQLKMKGKNTEQKKGDIGPGEEI
jgi:hypothetical protein